MKIVLAVVDFTVKLLIAPCIVLKSPLPFDATTIAADFPCCAHVQYWKSRKNIAIDIFPFIFSLFAL